MPGEVRDSHFSAENEGHGPGKQPGNDKQASEEFKYSGKPELRWEYRDGSVAAHASKGSEQLLRAMQRKRETGYRAQQRYWVTGSEYNALYRAAIGILASSSR